MFTLILLIVAVVLFTLAALAHVTKTDVNNSFLIAAGLAALALAHLTDGL